jgi:hypothetical protein
MVAGGLRVDVPGTWRRAGDGSYRIDGEERLVVTIGPLIPMPADFTASAAELLQWEVRATATIAVIDDRVGRSALGWPVRVVGARVVGPDGAVLESRLAVFFELLDHGAAVLARGARALERRAELLAVLDGARPEWAASTACIATLLEGFTEGHTASPAPCGAQSADPWSD